MASPKAGSPLSSWCWRGGTLTPEEIEVYRPGLRLKHLGTATVHLGSPQDFPVIFYIYVHGADLPTLGTSALHLRDDSEFWVREVRQIAGGRVWIGLEQRVPGLDLLEDFEMAFSGRVNENQGELPLPSPEERHESLKPFARWAWGAESGDPPLSGVLWDFDEAVQHAEAFCGEPRTAVEQVVAGRCRYLELAGMANQAYSEDALALLFREREAYRSLLPEEPTFVDDREIDFLVLSTGLPRWQVLRIVQGETAYQDRLGLIEWDDEAERCSALGLPMPEAMDSWSILFQGDGGARRRHMEDVRLRGRRVGSFPAGSEHSHRVEAMWLPSGSVTGTFGLRSQEGGLQRLLAAYPMTNSTANEPLHLHSVVPRRQGMEAAVEFEDAEGIPIRALVPAPIRFGTRLGPGRDMHGHLWLLADMVQPTQTGSTSGSLGLVSAGGISTDRTQFEGRIEASETVMAWGRRMRRLSLRIPWGSRSRLISLWAKDSGSHGLMPGGWIHGYGRMQMDFVADHP